MVNFHLASILTFILNQWIELELNFSETDIVGLQKQGRNRRPDWLVITHILLCEYVETEPKGKTTH